MNEEYNSILIEIREMLKVLADEHEKLMKTVVELREEQRKLREEVKLSNFVLNNFTLRNEMIN
ncbi:MAG: hypothetical protein N3B21_04530 [Clostridia bacterium]|nr:hypothetical protein [Clostridia bacterium]